jgi:hypothetical protein
MSCTCATSRVTTERESMRMVDVGDDAKQEPSTASSSCTHTRIVHWKHGADLLDAAMFDALSPTSPSPFHFTKQERMVKKREWKDEWRQIETAGGEEGKDEDAMQDASSEAIQTEKNLRLAAIHAAKR